ncbi:MAG: tryptophan 2,3-dioxygenase [Myxococcales bacterium]|nr:tryptophan 2,3-dioxygenase [Myxococcales bacterium]MBL0198128.1 tryptophan 2,3-dioxygenase [Myxococcales bacterium]HQY64001.1 tryptophan 2,3-dioxygenase family protein [Polyangiaceae bacterium]
MARPPTTYWDYIKVEELLSLQAGIADSEGELANDEVLFIVVHQIDELWMKLALRELVTVRDLFARPRVPEQALAAAVRGLRRIDLLFRQMADHFALMETMTTRDYLAFRDKLSPASGFQSAQLREIEILLGLPEEERIALGNEGSYKQALRGPGGAESPASRRVEARLADSPTLRDAVHAWLHRTPIQGSTPDDPADREAVRGFVDGYVAAHARATAHAEELAVTSALTPEDRARLAARYAREREGTRAFLLAEDLADEARRPELSRLRAALVFIESYRELPLLAWPREVVEAVVALEQGFVVFRQRHARMVERMIGRRTGTGGSAGVDYLDQTALKYRIFRDVWAVRTLLVREADLPPLERPELYGFAVE